MPRKGSRRNHDTPVRIVSFDFQEHTYQIDPKRQKVYRRFVEIETAKAFEIYAHWRSSQLGV